MKKKPPILTTDSTAIVVGMKLYAFDTCQTTLKLQTLKVIECDEGPKREIKLRRSNNREWSWSAKDRQGVCRSQNHMLYADKQKAEAEIAKRVAAKDAATKKAEVDCLKKRLRSKRRYLKDAKRSVADYEKEIRGLASKLKKLQVRS